MAIWCLKINHLPHKTTYGAVLASHGVTSHQTRKLAAMSWVANELSGWPDGPGTAVPRRSRRCRRRPHIQVGTSINAVRQRQAGTTKALGAGGWSCGKPIKSYKTIVYGFLWFFCKLHKSQFGLTNWLFLMTIPFI